MSAAAPSGSGSSGASRSRSSGASGSGPSGAVASGSSGVASPGSSGAAGAVVPDAAAGAGASGALDGAALWETVDGLVRWLDRESPLPPEQERLLRILKLSEEAGEVAQAVIGAVGQNPRKGHSHTWDDVHSELCDVIVTAMVALRTLTPDARRVFETNLTRVAGRVPGPTTPA